MPQVSWRLLKSRPFVPGTVAYKLVPADYSNFLSKLTRFSRDKHDLDIDVSATGDESMMIAFKKVFIPKWNGGKLDGTYYKDGYEFKLRNTWWRQMWIEEKKEFEFMNQDTKASQLENPRTMEQRTKSLKKLFLKYQDVILPDHYISVIATEEPMTDDDDDDDDAQSVLIIYEFTIHMIDDTGEIYKS